MGGEKVMAESNFQVRIVHKHDTEANWLLATNFIPKTGELIIYDIDASHSSPRFKIGDGTSTVTSLPFFSGAAADIGNATILKSGLMSSTDKIKLNNIEENATSVYVDSVLSNSSTNAIQNKAVFKALQAKADAEHIHEAEDIEGLSRVAISNSYVDLDNRPPIPSLVSQLVNDMNYITSADIERSENLSDYNNDVGFITAAVNNLTNYYNKANTYSKTEINNMLSGISGFGIRIVTELPTSGESNCFYFLKNDSNSIDNYYDEYIWIGENFELIGSTKINLTDYLTKVGNSGDTFVEFEVSTDRELPVTGQKLSTIFGKIVKFLSDLKAVAFSGSYNDLVDTPDVALKSDLTGLALKTDLDGVALKSDLTDLALKTDLDGVALKSDLTDLALKTDLDGVAFKKDLHKIAASGDYNDLMNVPDVALKGDLQDLVAKNELSEIAFSGSFADLTGTENLVTKAIIKEVAFSGSYNDLVDIPEVVSKSDLKDVAFSGDFNDLSNTDDLATKSEVNNKQDILRGTEGQVVQFNSEGVPVASVLDLITIEDIDTICGVID
jgi:hypothetical protein